MISTCSPVSMGTSHFRHAISRPLAEATATGVSAPIMPSSCSRSTTPEIIIR